MTSPASVFGCGTCLFCWGSFGDDLTAQRYDAHIAFALPQRQRLTIARALVRRSRFLILDDSASALDFATEAKLRHALKSLDYDPTVFIISQRTSSISHADKIIVLDDGRVNAIGTHEELLKSNEIYKELYYSQNREVTENA